MITVFDPLSGKDINLPLPTTKYELVKATINDMKKANPGKDIKITRVQDELIYEPVDPKNE
ncbi:MAG: hypothetical protein CL596_05185 [Alteromonas sp.]|nr:hypothetical protein [Alteromonas sp.]